MLRGCISKEACCKQFRVNASVFNLTQTEERGQGIQVVVQAKVVHWQPREWMRV